MVKPSYLAHTLSGLLIAWAVYLLIVNKDSSELSGTNLLKIVLLLSIAISLHGMMHMWAEIYYRYNPLENLKFYY
jgi:hypothetical protein